MFPFYGLGGRGSGGCLGFYLGIYGSYRNEMVR